MILYFLIAWILYTIKAPFWIWCIWCIGVISKIMIADYKILKKYVYEDRNKKI